MRTIELGRRPYPEVEAAMRAFTAARGADAPDELWLVEHEPVFTQGIAGRDAHVLAAGDIAVVRTDRGGQVTYHGPGQLIAYVLFDLRRAGVGVKRLVHLLEQAVIELLGARGIQAATRPDAPGVYVDGAKIASLGLRIRRGCSFHGLALNVDMDLSPFLRINPCGFPGLAVTQVADLADAVRIEDVGQDLGLALTRTLRVR